MRRLKHPETCAQCYVRIVIPADIGQATSLSEEQVQTNPFYHALVSKAASLVESNRELQETVEERGRFITSLQAKFEEDLSTYEVNTS